MERQRQPGEIHVDTAARRPFFSPRSLAEYLEVSERTVRQWIMDGKIASYSIDGRRRIAADDVDRMLQRSREEKAA